MNLQQPDSRGYWGAYGGRFVPETLIAPLDELLGAYESARADDSFQREFEDLLRTLFRASYSLVSRQAVD